MEGKSTENTGMEGTFQGPVETCYQANSQGSKRVIPAKTPSNETFKGKYSPSNLLKETETVMDTGVYFSFPFLHSMSPAHLHV